MFGVMNASADAYGDCLDPLTPCIGMQKSPATPGCRRTRIAVYLWQFIGSVAFAQGIYKSTDDQGNVIYSGQPPKSLQQIERIDAPTESSGEAVGAAEELQQQREQSNEQNEKERKAQEPQRRELLENRPVLC